MTPQPAPSGALRATHQAHTQEGSPHQHPAPARTGASAPPTTTRTPNRTLRTWRETHSLTRAQMAEALSAAAFDHGQGEVVACDYALITAWEAGRVRWPRPQYRRALQALTGQPPAALGFTPPPVRTRVHLPLHRPAFRTAHHDAQARSRLLENLVRLRTAHGLTQAQTAARMQTPVTFVVALEDGGTDPQLSTLQRYARAVDATLTVTLTTTSSPGQDTR